MLEGLGFELVSLDRSRWPRRFSCFDTRASSSPRRCGPHQHLYGVSRAKVCVLAAQRTRCYGTLGATWKYFQVVLSLTFCRRSFKVDEMFLFYDDYSIDLDGLRLS